MSNVNEEIKETILAKIAAKRAAADKSRVKINGLDEVGAVYTEAIEKHTEKIAALRKKIEGFAESRKAYEATMEKRLKEADEMEQVLESFEEMIAEGEELGQIMRDKIVEHTWYPGDPEEKKTALQDDEEYQKVRERKLEINDYISEILTTVNRIFYQR